MGIQPITMIRKGVFDMKEWVKPALENLEINMTETVKFGLASVQDFVSGGNDNPPINGDLDL